MTQKTWQQHLVESKQSFEIANHMASVTLGLLKENRILIKVISNLHKSVTSLIKAFLDLESKNKKIRLAEKPLKNLQIFIDSIAPKYLTEEESTTLIRILQIAKKHKDAHLEFVKKEKFVIFLGDHYETITAENVKTMLSIISRAISKFPILK